MPALILTLILAFSSAPVWAQGASRAFVGVITDSMCITDHESMKVSPDDRCVRECVGTGSTFKYALTDGARTYLLSDQQTPEKLAGRKVRVTGVLYTKTNIIKVDRIDVLP